MKKQILIIFTFLCIINSYTQNVGIGTNAPKDYAKLDIQSTTSGFQLPRMTTAQRNTLATNIAALSSAISEQYSGMLVYDTDNKVMYMWDQAKSTNGDWVDVLDSDASLNDADADPNNEIQNLGNTVSGTDRTITITSGTNTTISVADNDNSSSNEYNTGISLSGSNLTITDGGGNQTQDLSTLKDHDWYEVGGTNQADNISDNIYTNGNVGIGIAPSSKLHVNGSIRTQNSTINSGNDYLALMRGVRADDNSYEWVGFYSGNTRQGIILYDGGWSGANNLTNEFGITAESGNKLTLNTTGNSDVAIMPDGTGKVGIGTTSPSAKLTVNGWIGRTAHHNGGFVGSYNNIGGNGSKTNPIYVIGSNYKPNDADLANMYGIGYAYTNATYIPNTGSNSWGMYVAADGDARIWLGASSSANSYFNAGNLGIGTTSPSQKLHVVGNTLITEGLTMGDATSDVHNWQGTLKTTTTSDSHIIRPNGANYSFVGTNDYYFWYMYSNNFIDPSRRELKRNITPVEGNLSKLLMEDIDKIKPSFYKYKVETDEMEEGNEAKFRPNMHLGVILDEAPDYLQDQAFSGIDIYALGAFSLAGVKYNRSEIQDLKEKIVNETENGKSQIKNTKTIVFFSSEFSENLKGNKPLIYITPTSANSGFYLTDITDKSFTVIGSIPFYFNWFAKNISKKENVIEDINKQQNMKTINGLVVPDKDKVKIKEYWDKMK